MMWTRAGPQKGGGGSGDEWVSTQGKVVDASIRRNRAMHDRVLFETGTQAEELKAATKRMGVRARYTLPEQVWSEHGKLTGAPTFDF